MIRRLTGTFPPWARRDNPVLRYELDHGRPLSNHARWLRAAGMALLTLLLAVGGYLIATGFLTHPAGQSLSEQVHAIAYWPVLALQVLVGILALVLTATAALHEHRREHWDSLRTTANGVELALRARWAAVFYRLRFPLVAIVGLRLLLVVGIFYDLTAFQGRYLDLLLNGVTPALSLAAGVVLLALLMAAALLVPVTSVGLDAAVGLLLSTFVQGRTYNALLQAFLVLLRLAVVVGLATAVTRFAAGELDVPRRASAALVSAFAALGDGGLAYLNLGFFGELWSSAPWSILTCVGLLLFALAQALLTDWLVMLSVRRAERSG